MVLAAPNAVRCGSIGPRSRTIGRRSIADFCVLGTSKAHGGARGGWAEPELVPPESGHRGPQNQLYRVEIDHDGCVGGGGGPTFKVSRENGSVMFRIIKFRTRWSLSIVWATMHGSV